MILIFNKAEVEYSLETDFAPCIGDSITYRDSFEHEITGRVKSRSVYYSVGNVEYNKIIKSVVTIVLE